MQLKFKHQQFQIDAAKAVTDAFHGQRNQTMVEFTHDMGSSMEGEDLFDVVGYRNQPLTITAAHTGDSPRVLGVVCDVRK